MNWLKYVITWNDLWHDFFNMTRILNHKSRASQTYEGSLSSSGPKIVIFNENEDGYLYEMKILEFNPKHYVGESYFY